MANLRGLNDQVFFTIDFNNIEQNNTEIWQHVNLSFNTLWSSLNIKSQVNTNHSLTTTANGNKIEITNFGTIVLCRKPTDEIQLLSDNITNLIQENISQFSFEPFEPSFELNIKIIDAKQATFLVEAYLDLTNFIDGFYLGDAIGMKFYINRGSLITFNNELIAQSQIS